MKLNIIALSFFSLLFLSSIAQRQRCGSDYKIAERIAENPELIELRNQQNKEIAAYPLAKSRTLITIPVVVHVLYQNSTQNISNTQIQSQINSLNQDYRRLNADASQTPSTFSGEDTEIEFCLATLDPNGNPTSGITRTFTTVNEIGTTNNYYRTSQGGKDIWNRDEYLNIWVCDLGNTYLGFAYPPGVAPAAYDGLVIDYRNFGTLGTVTSPYDKGRTATHEIGHFFNLEHLWGSGNGGCNSTDFVSDTPTQYEENYGCLNHPSPSCGNSGDMFMNYMDYVDDACMNAFTLGQKNRMISAIQLYRTSLLTSNGCGLVGITENSLQSDFTIFPTYATKTIQLTSTKINNYQVDIYTIDGKIVSVNTTKGNTNLLLDVSTLESGMYFLRITSNGTSFTEKFLKVAQ